jgi:hypothetical protein
MAARGFVPIIEPVKASLSGLERTLDAVHEVRGRAVLVINPCHGDLADDPAHLQEYAGQLANRSRLMIGVALHPGMQADEDLGLIERFEQQRVALIHCGFTSARPFAERLGDRVRDLTHVFIEDHCTKLYRRHFESDERVLVRDGFQRRKNREYEDEEVFSDLHVTYPDEGVDGFGDFLIVGDEYFDSGGPAYAVAIHLTFIDPDRDKEMHIYHFKSDRSSSPQDPAGKFAEALEKLVAKVEDANSRIEKTEAVEEFLELHSRAHFPGLGYVKKLSMNHHIQTIASYFEGP